MSERKKTDQEILNNLVESAPFFQAASRDAIAISICDHEKWLLQLNHPELELPNKAGDPVSKKDDVIQGALRGNGGMGRPPYEVYGIHFFGKTTPIMNEGRVIGAMGMAYNIEVILKIEESIEKLNEIAAKIKIMVEEIIAQANKLSTSQTKLFEFSEVARRNSDEIDTILESIKGISRQSNILGLNASIEASRAGAAGKGFTVVANEIRNLAKDTSDSSDKINESIINIKDNISEIVKGISQMQDLSKQQLELIDSIESTLEDLYDIIRLINDCIRVLG